MQLHRYIARSRIIDLESTDFPSALEELVEVALSRLKENLKVSEIKKQLIARENTMTTYLGEGVAMPHIRVDMKRSYVFAIGRAPTGLQFGGLPEYGKIRLVFLLLASERAKNYLNVLASMARLFRDRELIESLTSAKDLNSFRDGIMGLVKGYLAKPERRQSRFNRILLREAEKIAREAKCAAILVFSDTFAGGIEITEGFPKFRTILVSRAARDRPVEGTSIETTIEVRSLSRDRLSQARSAILIGLTRGLFKYSDRLCCVGGIPASNQLDTVCVVDVEREFQSVLERENDLLPPSVKIEVIERMLAIATELAVEGREGKPIGTLFVIGDSEKVNTMVKPLVLNPFYGYREEERNVLNPFMDETIKEFSSMDGCFVIRGDGVIESAGSLIHTPPEFTADLPSGFGARHAAAAAVSRATDCVSLCVSASSGQVTLFRRGVMLPLIERPISSQVK